MTHVHTHNAHIYFLFTFKFMKTGFFVFPNWRWIVLLLCNFMDGITLNTGRELKIKL